MTAASPPPPAARPAELAALRQDLVGAGYTVDGVTAAIGAVATAALHREQAVPADLATRDLADPVAVLLRLLVLGHPVPAHAVDTALPRTGAEGLVAMGVAASSGPDLRGACDLRPYGEGEHTWWVCSDLGELALGGVLPTDHVLGVGGASATLAAWTPRPRAARALDLGAGCGVQALHLAGHTGTRVATDLSGRALAFAAFTAALNEVDLELRRGSLWEPVAGEVFDLIVSNPPFVITPRDPGVPHYEYRDGGRTGDAVVREMVTGAAAHLAPGGLAQLLGNWEMGPAQVWTDRLQEWLADSPLDAWVVQREEQDVAEYAETWARDGGHRPGTPAFDALCTAWLADFAERGVERIGFGIITLQRPQEQRGPWRSLQEVRSPVRGPMGPTVLAGVRARTWLSMHNDDEVLSVPWSVAPDVAEERIGAPGAPDPAVIRLRQGGGLGRVVPLDTWTAGVVGALDGDLSADQVVRGVAVLTGADPAAVAATVAPVLRELIADGLLR